MKGSFKFILGAILGAVFVLVSVFTLVPTHDKYASSSFNNKRIDIVPTCSAATKYVCLDSNTAAVTYRNTCKSWCDANTPKEPYASIWSCREGCERFYRLYWENPKFVTLP